MPDKLRALHYINQFFAGIGGEEKADLTPEWRDTAVGPGRLLERVSPNIRIVGTLIAGDNYMAENLDDGVDACFSLAEKHIESLPDGRPDILIAGPAFNAGRYGMACGAIAKASQNRLRIPAVTALYSENPAVAIYRRAVTIVEASDNVLGMRDALEYMSRVAAKLSGDETIYPEVDHTIPRGLRKNVFVEISGANRAINMLLAKIAGREFETEYAVPKFDRVPPAPAVTDLRLATIALVTSGGIVPRGNPDHIESASASRFGAYSIEGLSSLSSTTHQSVHGGYDPTFANADPNRVLPLDALRALEKAGKIGRLHNTYFATVGNATPVERAARFGREIAALLVNVGVQAVVFTST